METLVINIPDKKSALVKQLLKELGVTIAAASSIEITGSTDIPNALTATTIEKARLGVGLNKPIKDVHEFVKSL